MAVGLWCISDSVGLILLLGPSDSFQVTSVGLPRFSIVCENLGSCLNHGRGLPRVRVAGAVALRAVSTRDLTLMHDAQLPVGAWGLSTLADDEQEGRAGERTMGTPGTDRPVLGQALPAGVLWSGDVSRQMVPSMGRGLSGRALENQRVFCALSPTSTEFPPFPPCLFQWLE